MQDASLGEGQFGASLELGLIDSGRQAEYGNTLDGFPRDSPVEEEDDDIIPTDQLNRIEKRSMEEDLSILPSSRIDEVGRVEREANLFLNCSPNLFTCWLFITVKIVSCR